MSEVLNNRKGWDMKRKHIQGGGRGRTYIFFGEDALLGIIEKISSTVILLLALLSSGRVIRIDGKFKEEEILEKI